MTSTSSRNKTLAALAVLSGAFGINYEVLYYRLITCNFGDMLHVQASIMAAFLIGIVVGARICRPLRAYLWLMEILVGGVAVLFSMVMRWLEDSSLVKIIGHSPPLTVVACMILMAAPALLVGLSVPLYTEYLETTGAATGSTSFDAVYLLYNVGAVVSILVVEFVLIRLIGHRGTLFTLAAGNVLIGGLLYALFPEFRTRRWQVEDAGRGLSLPASVGWGLILLGTASSLFQMIFVRAAMEMTTPGRGVFTLSLAVVISGFPLGVYLRRRLNLVQTIHLATAAICVAFLLFPSLAALYIAHFHPLYTENVWMAGYVPRIICNLMFLSVLGLLPFTCFGAVIPLVLSERKFDVALVGPAMFTSGIGNAIGFLLYVFVVSPGLNVPAQLVTVIILAQCGLVAASGWPAVRRSRVGGGLALASLALLICFFTPVKYYEHHIPRPYHVDAALQTPGSTTVEVKHSAMDEAGVVRYVNPKGELTRTLFYNAQRSFRVVGSTPLSSELMAGVVPAIFARHRERACVFGIGLGTTPGVVANFFDHTDVIEINQAILDLLPVFRDVNYDLTANPKATLIHDDARTFLLHSPNPYDVIVNSVSVPQFQASGKIFTVEFLRRIKGSLKPGGVYMCWVGCSMNDDMLASIVGALRQVFPYSFATYLGQNYFSLACSDQPLSPRSIDSIGLPADVRSAVANLCTEPNVDLADYMDSLYLSDDFYRTLSLSGPINTDDYPRAEFVGTDPTRPITVLFEWPYRHPQFATHDFVGGKEVTPAEVQRRARWYPTEELRWVANKLVGAAPGPPKP